MGPAEEVKYVNLGNEDQKWIHPKRRQICSSGQFSLLISLVALAASTAIFSLLYFWYWEIPHMMIRYRDEVRDLRLQVDKHALHIHRLEKEVSNLNTRIKLAAEQHSRQGGQEEMNRNDVLFQAGQEKMTPGKKVPEGDVCSLPLDVGPCRGLIPRYFFNTTTQTCKSFYYGGCMGNGNNFHTAGECTAKCKWHKKHQQIDICQLPQDTGPCRALIPRWYFDVDDKTCKPFGYGGCDGNENNFENEDFCVRRCGGQKQGMTGSQDIHTTTKSLVRQDGYNATSQDGSNW